MPPARRYSSWACAIHGSVEKDTIIKGKDGESISSWIGLSSRKAEVEMREPIVRKKGRVDNGPKRLTHFRRNIAKQINGSSNDMHASSENVEPIRQERWLETVVVNVGQIKHQCAICSKFTDRQLLHKLAGGRQPSV